MGSCISKCKPKRKPINQNPNHFVQDKLIIVSQSPPPPPPTLISPRKRKILSPPSPPQRKNLSPPSPSPSPCPSSLNSTSSFSSFSCSIQSTNCTSSSSSSSLSSSSSCSSSSVALFSKVDRSFSNEFLLSCAKENPQIIGIDSIKHRVGKRVVPSKVEKSSTQKRPRASSPTLTRQKSLRIEQERPSSPMVNGRSIMRSPSPSRRFNGYTTTTTSSSGYQRPSNFSTSSQSDSNSFKRSVNFTPRKENLRPPSPKHNTMSKDRNGYLKSKERFAHEIDSKVDDIEIGDLLAKVKYSGDIPMEDIDNPHIALDCFIFL